MDNSFKYLYKNMITIHNQNNINNIENILKVGYFYLDNNKVNINNPIKLYLESIIDDIKIKNTYKETIYNENVEEYRLEIFKYKAINLFHKK